VTRLKWVLILFHLEIVLILTQDGCTICVERTTGSEIILDSTEVLGDVGVWNLVLVRLETILVLVQDRCMVCAKRTIGSEIILDTPIILLGDEAQVEA
jgi:sulfur transfer complex TusBCD TusB component (DsrH family)